MNRQNLFKKIMYSSYTKIGKDVDFRIEVDDENRIVFLLFQGTTNKTDVFVDLNFPVKVYKHQSSCIKAHGGFVSAWKSANDYIMNMFILQTSEYPEYTPVIAGHSLGGAMSVLACEDYFFRTGRKADLYTFGCPNTLWGNKTKKYITSCCGIVEQYAQYNDIIPVIPLFYRQLNKIKCGRKFNIFQFLFKGSKYHLGYGEIDYLR